MKRIHRIIYQETLAPTLITLLVLTFIVFTREFGRLVEILIRRNADPMTVVKAVVFLMPGILIFTLPFSFLIGTLIGFSRLSSDSEIVAMRSGGVSALQMLWPVLRIGILVAGMTAVFTVWLLPAGNWNLRMLQDEIRMSPRHSQIEPRIFFEDFPNILLYLQDIDRRTSTWKGIFVADSSEPNQVRIILADRGHTISADDGRRLQLHFEEGTIYTRPLDSPEKDNISQFGTLDIPVKVQEEEQPSLKTRRTRDKTLDGLLADIRKGDQKTSRESLVELHRRIALPISALIFAILGVTLGVRTPRSGRGSGFFVSVTVALSYYIMFATGGSLSKNGVLPIFIGVWGANALMGSLAIMTLHYANIDFRLLGFVTNRRLLRGIQDVISRGFKRLSLSFTRLTHRIRKGTWRFHSIRFRLTRVIDLYMSRLFLVNLAVTVLICLALVCIFTFFEIIDNVFENNIPYSLVLDYFLFLQPHLLMLLFPMSILIATLITFGSLEKSSQIVAFKSCGISLYRIAMPLLLLAVGLCVFLFVIQEYVLPYANQRQDNLRRVIQGRPIQTSQPGLRWIFGEGNRLYRYKNYQSERNAFADLSAYQIEIKGNGLIEHIHAQRAFWDRNDQSWVLLNGWRRSFSDGRFETFKQRSFKFAETPEYFDEDINDSSKMTYPELKAYISDLQTGGFNVDHLQTELHKKLSFPIVNLIMVVIGLPFAVTTGRKGALFGIAAGVLMGIVYWGAFGVFDVLGANGLLAPVLAAWGPNILFGAGGLITLSAVRT